MQKTFQNISIPKLPVLTRGNKQIRNNLDRIIEWKNIIELIPKFYLDKKMKRTGLAGILLQHCSKEELYQFLKKNYLVN